MTFQEPGRYPLKPLPCTTAAVIQSRGTAVATGAGIAPLASRSRVTERSSEACPRARVSSRSSRADIRWSICQPTTVARTMVTTLPSAKTRARVVSNTAATNLPVLGRPRPGPEQRYSLRSGAVCYLRRQRGRSPTSNLTGTASSRTALCSRLARRIADGGRDATRISSAAGGWADQPPDSGRVCHSSRASQMTCHARNARP